MKIFTQLDETFVYVAIWHMHLGGHWCGYVGFLDPMRQIKSSSLKLHGGATGEISGDSISDIDPTIVLPGFHCIHAGDSNIGPNGEIGVDMCFREKRTIWTKDNIFEHLKITVAE